MKTLIVLDLKNNDNLKENEKYLEIEGGGKNFNQFDGTDNVDENYTYDMIIDALIKGQKIKFEDPNINIGCRISSKILSNNSDLHKILGSFYDHILITDSWNKDEINDFKKRKGYDKVEQIGLSEVGVNDNQFDTDYEYHIVKKILGPKITNHFMFKERDIEVRQRGGFNFNEKKIKYHDKKSNPNLQTICHLYRIHPKMIKNFQLEYFHASKNIPYRPFNIRPMFDDIQEYDYSETLIRLSKYHSDNNYYQKLYERNRQYLNAKNKIRLNMIDEISPEDRDSIITQYIKCRPNTFIITIWKPAIPVLDKFVEFLEKNGSIYYIKTESMSKKTLRNLMFWMYDEFAYTQRFDFFEKKLEYIEAVDENNPTCFIVFDNTMELRDKLMEYTQLDKEKFRGNDLIHINDYFYQTIEYSELIFNENSLKVLSQQNSFAFASPEFILPNLKIQTLRKILYSELSLLEMDRFITMGGTVLYAYGIRAFNDVDAIVINVEPNSTPELTDKIEKFFVNKSSKIYFLDAGIQGSSSWNESWSKKDQKIINFLNINDFKDLTLDPKNYLVTLEFEMIRKIIRNRTEDHIDFLMLNLLYPKIINDYVTLNEQTQQIDNKYFIINDKYKDIAGEYDNRFPEMKYKFLKRRYSSRQIEKAKKYPIFDQFFK
jgi:hypothetical protein